ncbi:MAG TPA: hypothetical protein VMA36_00005, partial [Candidatus Limnocylindria bacterium]|nr:hypothetical protein [Candidatus Limnocylindria bacterium]
MNPTLRRLLREARPYYPRLVVAMLFGVLAGVAPLTLAKVAGYLQSSILVPHPNWNALVLVIALVIGSQIVGNLAAYGQAYLTAFSGQRMVATLR